MIDLTPKLDKGDAVQITYEGRTVLGRVVLADKHGLAGVVSFEAILGGYVGMMLVMTNPDKTQVDLLMGKPVKIERAENDGWTDAPDGGGGSRPPPDITELLAKLVGRQAEGAIPNEARIVKVKGDDNDRTPEGTLGTVKGSVHSEHVVKGRKITHCYVVYWDNCPDVLVATTDFKIRRAE